MAKKKQKKSDKGLKVKRADPNEYEYDLIERIRESDKAILVRIKCDSATMWLPNSQIDYTKRTKNKTKIRIPEWLAIQRGLIDDPEKE